MNEFSVPTIYERARRVKSYDGLEKIAHYMFDKMLEAGGVGLAAPQIGLPIRMFVWGWNGDNGVAINPKIEPMSTNYASDEEGCLSFPGESVTIERLATVRLIADNVFGQRKRRIASGMVARIFQHEVDHCSGLTIMDYRVTN